MRDTNKSHTAHPAQSNRVLALAALVQALYLVDTLAVRGTLDQEDFATLIGSLFPNPQQQHAGEERVVHLYGELYRLHTGLRIARILLRGMEHERAKPLLSYTAGVMALERRLQAQPEMLRKIGEGMEKAHRQSDYFGSRTHENVVANIAGLYAETISTLPTRIIVRGRAEHLNAPGNGERIRALLLAGIRAAHLWRKHGGGHLRLLFGRKALAQEIERLLADASRV